MTKLHPAEASMAVKRGHAEGLGTDRVLDGLFLMSLVVVGLIVPASFSALISEWTIGKILLLIIIIYSGTRLATVALRGRARILQLFFWTFVWIFLGLAPLAQSAAEDWPWPGGVSEDVLWRSALIILISVLTYDVGLVIGKRSDSRELRPPKRVLSVQRLKVGAVIAVVACVTQILLIGPETLLADRAARSASSTDTSSGAIQQALLVSVIFVVSYLFIRAKRGGVLKGYTLVTVLLVGLTLFVSNPLSSSRYRFASVAVALLLAFLWPATRRQMAALAGALLFGLAFLFPLLNSFRKDSYLTAADGVLQYLRQGDYDAFQQLANTVNFVDERGITNGMQGLSALFFFIPRAVWPEKALDTGVLVANFRDYEFTNLSAPLQAEAYINGGPLAVVIFFVLLGVATSYMERRASDPMHVFSFSGLFIPVIAAYQVIMLRGSLLQSMAGFAVILVVTWLATERVSRPGSVGAPQNKRLPERAIPQ